MGSTENKKNIKYEINDYLQISLKINSLLNLCDNGWEFEIQNENSFQKKLVPSRSYMNSDGFIDVALFFLTILTSALSILTIMLSVIKSHL